MSGISEAEYNARLGIGPGVHRVGESQSMTEDEAFDIRLGIRSGSLEEATRVIAEAAAAQRTPSPHNAAVFEKKIQLTQGGLLDRVASNPGGRTTGFTEAEDRRMDAAFHGLLTLAESRMGMTRDQSQGHAQLTFSELQHAAATADETRETFVRRLEQRVKAYESMSPLIADRPMRRAGA